jgi:hypothetical protein
MDDINEIFKPEKEIQLLTWARDASKVLIEAGKEDQAKELEKYVSRIVIYLRSIQEKVEWFNQEVKDLEKNIGVTV